MRAEALLQGPDDRQDATFLRWQQSLRLLMGTRESARSWRQSRYQFAHRLGAALAGPLGDGSALQGPVVYGIWLRWGLLYVGQTSRAERRLRDLPVGESHHLANTFPPEIWHRVVVVAWPRLAGAEALTERLQPRVVGLALEHLLQSRMQPLVNCERRKPDGGWRDNDFTRSRSVGALATPQVLGLFHEVQEVWDRAVSEGDGAWSQSHAWRVVFPETLLR